MNLKFKPQSVYQVDESGEEHLLKDLTGEIHKWGPLLFSEKPWVNSPWAKNIWKNPELIPIESIGDAAKKLNERHELWHLESHDFHRRASLILSKINSPKLGPYQYDSPPPKREIGTFTLIEENLIIAATDCSSEFPGGDAPLIENKDIPPNRAYLKLWEVFLRIGDFPKKGEQCLDFGGSPGGWAWAIQDHGAIVTAFDRAPLDPKIESLPNVKSVMGDAFQITPDQFQKVDWFFCDLICAPEKLFQWLKPWIDSNKVKNFVVTVKFKGEAPDDIIQKFNCVPNSRMIHLNQNKNELTWVLHRAT